MATALQLEPYFVGVPPEQVRERTVSAARHALELDSTLADAHVALGFSYVASGRWKDAMAEMQRGIRFEPDNVAALQSFARLLTNQGHASDAIAILDHARRVERLSPLVSAWLAYDLFHRRPTGLGVGAERPRNSARLGDTARALDYLERSAKATGPLWVAFISVQDPAFDILRPNRRFAVLLRNAGLDVATLTSPHGGRTW